MVEATANEGLFRRDNKPPPDEDERGSTPLSDGPLLREDTILFEETKEAGAAALAEGRGINVPRGIKGTTEEEEEESEPEDKATARGVTREEEETAATAAGAAGLHEKIGRSARETKMKKSKQTSRKPDRQTWIDV